MEGEEEKEDNEEDVVEGLSLFKLMNVLII